MKGFTELMDIEGFSTSNERHLMLEMYWRADRKGTIRRTQGELAHMTLLSLPTVKRLMRAFEDRGVLERVGHGRYRLIVAEDFEILLEAPRTVPNVPGADEELARLQAVRRPDQGIAYTREGWPVLIDG